MAKIPVVDISRIGIGRQDGEVAEKDLLGKLLSSYFKFISNLVGNCNFQPLARSSNPPSPSSASCT